MIWKISKKERFTKAQCLIEIIFQLRTDKQIKTNLANENLTIKSLSLQEFEVIAQIKLLQLASNNYSFTQDSHFREWFAGVEKLSEAERLVRIFKLKDKQKLTSLSSHSSDESNEVHLLGRSIKFFILLLHYIYFEALVTSYVADSEY